MASPDIKINVDPKDGVLVIEHRDGKALELRHPNKIDIKGDLNAPRNFFECRSGQFPVETSYCHCTATMSQLTIQLVGEDRAVDRIIVTGQGKANPSLDGFLFNTKQGHSIPELVSLLRFRKHMFTDTDAFQSLLRSLTAFKATIDTKIEDVKEANGGMKKLLEKGVQSDVPPSFMIEVQPFLNGPRVALLVETEVKAHADHVTIELYAFSLENLKRECAIEVFDKMTESIAKAGIPVIHCTEF